MIIGIGSDIAAIERITRTLETHGERFLKRCFTQAEINHVTSSARKDQKRLYAGYAKRWAAKEACAKALGCGIRDGVFLKDFSVNNDSLGRPTLDLSGGAAEKLQQLLPSHTQAKIDISLSDDGGFALAFIVISALTRNTA